MWNKINFNSIQTMGSSSSHKSNIALMAVPAWLGKYLKKRVMNCEANLFSPGDPFTAFRIDKNSSSCYVKKNKKQKKNRYRGVNEGN